MKLVEPFAARKGTPIPPGVGRRLSIDPGLHTGFALWGMTGFLVACGTGEPPMAGTTDHGVRHVVIECPQAYKNSPVPYNDLIILAFMAGRYIGKCQASPFPVEARWMWPHEWGGSLPKNVKENRVRRKLTAEELLIVKECEGFVAKSYMNNVWDALGIGLHAWRGGI